MKVTIPPRRYLELVVRCVSVFGAVPSFSSRVGCGNAKQLGYAKSTHLLVNLYSYSLPGGMLYVSWSGAGGEAGPYTSYQTHGMGRCRSIDGTYLARRRVARRLVWRQEWCNATIGVGSRYWAALRHRVGLEIGKRAPDAVVLNYALHHAHVPNLCASGTYEHHMHFYFASARASLGNYSALIWHSGYITHLPATPGARLPPGWSCRTPERLGILFDQGLRAARAHGLHILNAMSISAAWPTATSDNRHYDGGFQNHLRQTVSLAVLNELLNLLSTIAAGQKSDALDSLFRWNSSSSVTTIDDK